MPLSISQRQAITGLLKDDLEETEIAALVGVTLGRVAVVEAHIHGHLW